MDPVFFFAYGVRMLMQRCLFSLWAVGIFLAPRNQDLEKVLADAVAIHVRHQPFSVARLVVREIAIYIFIVISTSVIHCVFPDPLPRLVYLFSGSALPVSHPNAFATLTPAPRFECLHAWEQMAFCR